MNVVGYDNIHRLTRLPDTLEEYFSGAAKRFAHIVEMRLEYGDGVSSRGMSGSLGEDSARDGAVSDEASKGAGTTSDEAEKLSVSGGLLKGDFALLRAFLADHDGSLKVRIAGRFVGDVGHAERREHSAGTEMENADKAEREKPVLRETRHAVELFFPAYLYGFVEDTFARAIHHKIEGSGYACRECVGKYEIRLREYDRLLRRVADDDRGAAVHMALCRLLYPVDLADVHRQGYEDFLKENDAFVLAALAAGESDLAVEAAYLTSRRLLSQAAVDGILPKLSGERYAEAVAVLLRYGKKKRQRLQI